MGYFAAAPDRLSREPIDGGIEITRAQYKEALAALADLADTRVISVVDGVFSLVDPPPPPEPEPPAPPTRSQLVAYADGKLQRVQDAGCVVNGVEVSTTVKGLTMLNGAVARAIEDPAAVVTWVVSETVSVQLDAASVRALGVAVAEWIQTTYAALEAVYAAIVAGTITTCEQIDAAAWPSNT